MANTIKNRSTEKNSISAKKILNRTVTSAKLARGCIKTEHLNSDVINYFSDSGFTGPTGATGATGATGPQGPNAVTESTTTNLAGFLIGKDSNVDAVNPWIILVGEATTNGVSVAITGGTYLVYNYNGTTVYRFITTSTDANGYPIEDSFYTTLSGGSLSGKICQRNI